MMNAKGSRVELSSPASATSYARPPNRRELQVDGVGSQTPSFQIHAISDDDNAIESQVGFRAVPCDDPLDGVLVNTA
jgi:hypothetical protein